MEERTIGATRRGRAARIRVRVDEVERSDGRRATREVVEHPGAVAILAWDGERLAMVRQWRHATGQHLLEIPAGTLEPDEATARDRPARAGRGGRGWRRPRGSKVPASTPRPASATELMHLYLATDLTEATGRR